MTRVVFTATAPNQREYVTVREPAEDVVARLGGGSWVELTQDLGRGRSARIWVNPASVRYVVEDEPS